MKSIHELWMEYTVNCDKVDTPELRDKYRCISKEVLALLIDKAYHDGFEAGLTKGGEIVEEALR